jgi:cysteine desulfurase / selenocysteine lyase
MFDPHTLKKDFPIFQTTLKSGKPLVYLDSAATSQKPYAVIDALVGYYTHDNANVHRGIHELGDRSTKAWHHSRETIASFFSATPEELVMVRNTTEALNMVAYTWGEHHVQAEDIILVTQMDHHSNLVPWQELAKRRNAFVELIPLTADGELDLSWVEEQLSTQGKNIKIVALPHVSNTLGTVVPVNRCVALVRRFAPQAIVVLDAAQSAPHMPVDFHTLDVDFMAVSAHKMLGPMGVGGLFVKKEVLRTLDPWLFGGGMIGEVGETSATFSDDLEERFTAGTPDVAGAVGWAEACTYLSSLGMAHVCTHDQELIAYTLKKLSEVKEVTIVGPKRNRCGSVAFVYEGVHAHDVAQILDSEGIAVRSGHHCTMPLHKKFGWASTTRLSFNVYSTREDVDALVSTLDKVKEVFGK